MLRPADREIRMVVRVVADLVPLRHNSPNEIRIFFRVHADEEKSGFYSSRLQNVEDLRRPLGIRAIVKGQCDLVFTTDALVIEGRKFRKGEIGRAQKTLGVLLNLARSIHARFIDANDLTSADV